MAAKNTGPRLNLLMSNLNESLYFFLWGPLVNQKSKMVGILHTVINSTLASQLCGSATGMFAAQNMLQLNFPNSRFCNFHGRGVCRFMIGTPVYYTSNDLSSRIPRPWWDASLRNTSVSIRHDQLISKVVKASTGCHHISTLAIMTSISATMHVL